MFLNLPSGAFRIRITAHRTEEEKDPSSGLALDDISVQHCAVYSKFIDARELLNCYMAH